MSESLSTAARRTVTVALIAWLAVATFPSVYFALRPGLDISWVYGLNHFVHSPFHFGRDVNFTYGPLGFLLYPADFGSDVALAILFRTLAAGAFALFVGLLAPRTPVALAFFAAGYGIALGVSLPYEFHLLIVLALGAQIAVEKRSLPALMVLAALAAPLWLVKFSIGMAAATVVVAAAIAWRLAGGGRTSGSVAAVATHVLGVVASGRVALGSFSDFSLWLRASREIAAGYSAGMSLDRGWTDLPAALAICGVYVAAASVLFAVRARAVLPLGLLAGALFLAFKGGFIREDGHVNTLFGFAPAALAVPLLLARSWKERGIAALALSAAAAIGGHVEVERGYLEENYVEAASGRRGFGGVLKAVRIGATRAELRAATAASIAPDRLPDEVRRVIGAGTVAIIPWELIHCLASQLACVPLQTLQLYSAYTPYLDAITAAQFEARDGADFVLVHLLQIIDDRNLVLDDPLTWRALLDRYQPVPLASKEFVVLRRRATSAGLSAVPVSAGEARFGEWIEVPRAPGFTFASLGFDLSVPGRIQEVLHRIPAGSIELRRASGAIEKQRLIFATSVNGVLVQPFPARLEDLPATFDESEGDRVVAIRVSGPATRSYRDGFRVGWLTASARSGPANAGAQR